MTTRESNRRGGGGMVLWIAALLGCVLMAVAPARAQDHSVTYATEPVPEDEADLDITRVLVIDADGMLVHQQEYPAQPRGGETVKKPLDLVDSLAPGSYPVRMVVVSSNGLTSESSNTLNLEIPAVSELFVTRFVAFALDGGLLHNPYTGQPLTVGEYELCFDLDDGDASLGIPGSVFLRIDEDQGIHPNEDELSNGPCGDGYLIPAELLPTEPGTYSVMAMPFEGPRDNTIAEGQILVGPLVVEAAPPPPDEPPASPTICSVVYSPAPDTTITVEGPCGT